jgi:hypothetical protein
MGAAVVPAVHAIVGWLASEGVVALVVRTILINVTLANFQTRDENGETLYAIGHDPRG